MDKKKKKKPLLEIHHKVLRHSTTCDVCGYIIHESNWYIAAKVTRFYRSGPKDYHYSVHDNEDICLSKMKVRLGLASSNFLATRSSEPVKIK